MKHATSPFRRVLEFVGSVKMTVVLLVLGVVVLSAGTILESLSDAQVAQSRVYRTFWFTTFLLLLVANLAAAVINRLPLKRHQLAFAVTHASLIVLAGGAWMSWQFGFEGQLAVAEGQGSSDLYLHDRELALVGPLSTDEDPSHRHLLAQFPLPSTVYLDGTLLQEEGGGQPGMRILRSVHDGFLRSGVQPAAPGSGAGPGADFRVAGQGAQVDGALVAFHPGMRRHDLGALEVEMVQFRDAASFAERRMPMSTETAVVIERGEGEEPLRMPLPATVGTEQELRPGVTVAVLAFAERARVVDGRMQDDPRGNYNPAAVVEVRAVGRTEKHTVFSEFPDFSLHQAPEGEPLTAGVRLEAFGAVGKPLLSVLVGPDAALYTQVSDGSGRREAVPFAAGSSIPVGDLPFVFEMGDFHPEAKLVVDAVRAEPDAEGGRFLVEVEVQKDGARETVWLVQGQPQPVPMLGPGMQLEFRRRTRQLPFRVDVDSFEVDYYPGSMRPANYASHVRVSAQDGSAPLVRTTISMNRPLDYMGYRIFQSSYVAGQGGQPDTTVFSVAYDPGVPVVYASFIFLILGVAWYVMGDGRRKDKDPNGRRAPATERDYVLSPEAPSAAASTVGEPSAPAART